MCLVVARQHPIKDFPNYDSAALFYFVYFNQRLDEEQRPTGCILCPMRGDVEINYKVSFPIYLEWSIKPSQIVFQLNLI